MTPNDPKIDPLKAGFQMCQQNLLFGLLVFLPVGLICAMLMTFVEASAVQKGRPIVPEWLANHVSPIAFALIHGFFFGLSAIMWMPFVLWASNKPINSTARVPF